MPSRRIIYWEARLEQTTSTGVFTIGYEGRVVEDFIEDLMNSGIQVLVDVRELPVSRKRGFSKSALSALVQEEGIEYLHLRELGSPRQSRRKLKEGGDFEEFLKEYADHLQANPQHVNELQEVVDTGKRTAIMCFERDHKQCHRNFLVHALREEPGNGFELHHI